ncbi:hypothetical protein C8R43DRAFT_939611 [Mycena crocata]|nr:hypothetical protein C8R43DRAFT_939611 [Mycena crocata]
MTSAFLSRFLGTNDPPSQFEAQEVRARSHEAQNKLRSIEASLTRMRGKPGSEAAMLTLTRDAASLSQRIRRCRSILSPIRRIPAEILTRIFLFTAPTLENARRVEWYASLQGSPWVLGQISGRWRAVALATPSLWSCIIVKNSRDESGDDCPPCSIPMLQTQLVRSGNAPLKIIFDYTEDDADDDVVREALNVITRYSSHWKSIYITAPQVHRLPSLRGKVPLLEKVSVFGWEGEGSECSDYGDTPPPPPDIFRTAPRLWDVEVDEGMPFFGLPWKQLRRYKSCAPWEGHINSLRDLKSAETCSLTLAHEHSMREPYRGQWGTRTVELPKLRQLELSTERSQDLDPEDWECPQWLRLPALTDLAIDSPLLRGLPRLLQASGCSLKKLHLTSRCGEADSVRPILQANPEITELYIDLLRSPISPVSPTRLISMLAFQRGKPALLPNLETLIVSSLFDKYEDTFANMVVSRWKTAHPKFCSLHISDPRSDRLHPKLNRLRSEGLAIYIHRLSSRCAEPNYGEEFVWGHPVENGVRWV